MNDVQLISLTWNGATFYRYATGAEPGAANAEAGEIMDRLADQFGDGFGYRVEAIPYRRTCDGTAVRDAAADAYASGAWPPSEAVPGCNAVADIAARLRRMAAELESGA
jgi:hypothetical protein